jgi:hypothetical protein
VFPRAQTRAHERALSRKCRLLGGGSTAGARAHSWGMRSWAQESGDHLVHALAHAWVQMKEFEKDKV